VNRFSIFPLLLFLALSACGRQATEAERALPPERFIEVNVALREIPRDHEQADSIRAMVLGEHDVSEEELRRFVLARSAEPAELAAVWDEIHRRLIERRADEEPIDPERLELDDEAGGLPEDDADAEQVRPGMLPAPAEPRAPAASRAREPARGTPPARGRAAEVRIQ
jgi:hypothetical protein